MTEIGQKLNQNLFQQLIQSRKLKNQGSVKRYIDLTQHQSTRKISTLIRQIFHLFFLFFYSARKYFQEGKIIIFIKPKADVQGRRNPQNITNYMSQNITVFTQIVGLEMEKFVNQLHVSLQEAFIGNIWLKNISLIMTKYIMTIIRNFFLQKMQYQICFSGFPMWSLSRKVCLSRNAQISPTTETWQAGSKFKKLA